MTGETQKATPMPRRTVVLIEVSVVVILLALLWAVVTPMFSRTRGTITSLARCRSNQLQIVRALQMYEEEHHCFPTALTLLTKLTPYPKVFSCPASDYPNGYVYNSAIAGKTRKDFAKTADTTFVTADGQHTTADGRSPNVAYTMADLDTARHTLITGGWPFRRHGPARFYATFLDGHGETITPEQAKGWLP
jgi:hypothetical protein